MLWTFNDGSFVPHEQLPEDVPPAETPVLLSSGVAPSANVDIIVDLAPDLPSCLSQTPREDEMIDGDDMSVAAPAVLDSRPIADWERSPRHITSAGIDRGA